MRLTQHHS